VLVLAPCAHLNVAAGLPTSATTPSADGAVIQEKPTPRELEILRLVEQGLTNREMARQFRRSPRAIQFHVSNLFSKLNARSRTELIHLARRRGWLT
jgi:DNA-binding NarL/FixJ family response regulator